MQRINLIFCFVLSFLVLIAKAQNVAFSLTQNGLSSITWNGNTFSTSNGMNPSAPDYKYADGTSGYAGSPSSRTLDSDGKGLLLGYPYGSAYFRYTATGNKLAIDVTIKNTKNSAITFLEITPFILSLPSAATNWNGFITCNNMMGPTVCPLKGSWGTLVMANEDPTTYLITGFPYVDNSPTNTVFQGKIYTSYPSWFPNSYERIYRNVPANGQITFNVALYFGSGSDATQVAWPSVQKWLDHRPNVINWNDHRALGMDIISVAEEAYQSATNPRGWFGDPSLNVFTDAGKTALRNRMLARADTIVNNCKAMNCQGIVTWDIEGQEFPHATSYICDPRLLATFAPEMDPIANEYFAKFTNAGIRVGTCIRPQKVVYNNDITWADQQYVTNEEGLQLMKDKVTYAKQRWGATIFYVDTNVNSNGGIMDPQVFRDLQLAFPDCLFFPEWESSAYFGVGAPYNQLNMGVTSTPADARVLYPNAFSMIVVNNGNLGTKKDIMKQSVLKGDILMAAAWFWSSDISDIAEIYSVVTPSPSPIGIGASSSPTRTPSPSSAAVSSSPTSTPSPSSVVASSSPTRTPSPSSAAASSSPTRTPSPSSVVASSSPTPSASASSQQNVSPSSSPSKRSVSYTLTAQGITSLSFDGNNFVNPQVASFPAAADVRFTDGTSAYYASPTSSKLEDQGKSLTLTYPYGKVKFRYTANGNKFSTEVTVTNTGSKSIKYLDINPLRLTLPSAASNWNGNPIVGSNVAGPAVPSLLGAWGVLVATSEEVTKNFIVGFPATDNSPTNTQFAMRVFTEVPSNLVSWYDTVEKPIAAGQSATYKVSLRFGVTGEDVTDLASDIYTKYRRQFPFSLYWADRRPIGMEILSVAESAYHSASNPRGWFANPNVDVMSEAGKANFKSTLLARAQTVIDNCDCQGVVIWDIEGQQFPHPTSYIGDPRALPTFAPEMDAIANEYIGKFTSAGLRVGFTIRPQKLQYTANLSSVNQTYVSRTEVLTELKGKVTYAMSRFGASLFYITSNFNEAGAVLDSAIIRELFEEFPGALFIPEGRTDAYHSASAPFTSFSTAPGTQPSAVELYPDAFSVVYVSDSVNESTEDEMQEMVNRGEILLVRSWYYSPEMDTIAGFISKSTYVAPEAPLALNEGVYLNSIMAFFLAIAFICFI